MFIKTCNYKIGLFGLLVATEKFRIRFKKIPANFLEKYKAVRYQYAQLIFFIFTYTEQESAFNRSACPKWQ
jgi:hypothetical protein